MTGVWAINANGSVGDLNITSIDDTGSIQGTVLGDPIEGFWSKRMQRIVFMRISDANDLSTLQVFTGYYWREPQPPPVGIAFLAGSFEAFQGSGGTAQRSVFGWIARKSTLTGIVPPNIQF
jgi:hypothetical protein